MANIDNVQLPDGSSYNIVDNTSGFATQNYVDSAVDSVTKTTIGLGNVDNTSDLNKPISTATQAALDTLDEDKADKTDIASVESSSTASQSYAIGEQFYCNGLLYKATAVINSGGTITPNGNCTLSNSITEQLSAIYSKIGTAFYRTQVNVPINTAISGMSPFAYKGVSLEVVSSGTIEIISCDVQTPNSGDWLFSTSFNDATKKVTVYANGSATVLVRVLYRKLS